MKIQVKAKDLTSAIKTVVAVHDFGESAQDRQPCCLTADENGLKLESARLGAYVVKRIDGKLLREGSVGMNAKDLAAMKLTGTVTIDSDGSSAKFMAGKGAYRWAADQDAQQDVEEQRGEQTKIKPLAKIPAALMQAGAKFATYKSDLQGDYDVHVTIDKHYFEYYGVDHISYGRYEAKGSVVKTKKPIGFVLGNSFLHKVTKEIGGDQMTVGMSADGSVVRFSGEGYDLFHPTIDKQHRRGEDTINTVTKGDGAKLVCRFVVKRNELKSALDQVAPIGKKSPDATMVIVVKKDGSVTLKQHAQEGAAVFRVETEKVKVRKDINIVVRAQYLQEFVRVAPTTVPLTVESWNGKFLRILVQEESTVIDYMAMMVSD